MIIKLNLLLTDGFLNDVFYFHIMMKTKKCFECKEDFEYDSKARFARKYCKECSEKRKKMWDEQWKIKAEDLEDE